MSTIYLETLAGIGEGPAALRCAIEGARPPAAESERRIRRRRDSADSPKLLAPDMSQCPCAYRYRTAALVGPWRDRSDKARDDAIRARQARYDKAEGFLWVVSGTIEALRQAGREQGLAPPTTG